MVILRLDCPASDARKHCPINLVAQLHPSVREMPLEPPTASPAFGGSFRGFASAAQQAAVGFHIPRNHWLSGTKNWVGGG